MVARSARATIIPILHKMSLNFPAVGIIYLRKIRRNGVGLRRRSCRMAALGRVRRFPPARPDNRWCAWLADVQLHCCPGHDRRSGPDRTPVHPRRHARSKKRQSRQSWPPVTICWFNLRTLRPICSMPPMPSPRARHQWARLRHQFSSKHTNTRGTAYYDSSIRDGGNNSGRFAAMSRNARTKALPTSTLGTSNGHIPSK